MSDHVVWFLVMRMLLGFPPLCSANKKRRHFICLTVGVFLLPFLWFRQAYCLLLLFPPFFLFLLFLFNYMWRVELLAAAAAAAVPSLERCLLCPPLCMSALSLFSSSSSSSTAASNQVQESRHRASEFFEGREKRTNDVTELANVYRQSAERPWRIFDGLCKFLPLVVYLLYTSSSLTARHVLRTLYL